MITEDYVSSETTKLLKDKGFDVNVINSWHIVPSETCNFEDLEKFVCGDINEPEYSEDYYPMITTQMAMKWLREKHNIYISIQPDFPSDKDYKMCWCWSVSTLHENCVSTKGHQCYIETYEEAVEAAIKYCLENLI